MDFDEIRELALSFPGVEEHLVLGGTTLRIGKRFLACIAKIDKDTLVLKVPDPLEREMLLATQPEVYYLTDHYAGFEALLIRMPKANREEVHRLIERAWRHYAPKRLVAAYGRKD